MLWDVEEVAGLEWHLRIYRNGRDVAQTARELYVIDFFGLTIEEARQKYPEAFQWILDRVKPERDQNRRDASRDAWWIFGEARATFRPASGLSRFIATPTTAKHRFFVFLDGTILPDDSLTSIALNDAFYLGVLSSGVHVCWALEAGSTLEDRPRYIKSRCFEPFPFPAATECKNPAFANLANNSTPIANVSKNCIRRSR